MDNPTPPRPSQPVLEAEARAQAGDFSGLSVIVDALRHEDEDVRLRAAYVAGRIGAAAAIGPLASMALHDRVPDNRAEAILSLAGIARPEVVPTLIAALGDEEVDRRMDARVALYQVLGPDVFEPLVDEDENEGPDQTEIERTTAWWAERARHLDPARVYAFGVPASPGVFIDHAEAAESSLPDAYLNTLTNWTGQDFGQSPLPNVLSQWKRWWSAEQRTYEPGRRYFFGRRVP